MGASFTASTELSVAESEQKKDGIDKGAVMNDEPHFSIRNIQKWLQLTRSECVGAGFVQEKVGIGSRNKSNTVSGTTFNALAARLWGRS